MDSWRYLACPIQFALLERERARESEGGGGRDSLGDLIKPTLPSGSNILLDHPYYPSKDHTYHLKKTLSH